MSGLLRGKVRLLASYWGLEQSCVCAVTGSESTKDGLGRWCCLLCAVRTSQVVVYELRSSCPVNRAGRAWRRATGAT